MKTSSVTKIARFAAVLFIAVAAFIFAHSASFAQEAEPAESSIETSIESADETTVIESTTQTAAPSDDTVINVDDIMQDRFLGNADAPVTIIEYASMTCIHCANFHNEKLSAVKQELIDSGKVKFIFREFPLDAVALRASMMARCVPQDKFFGLIEVLFANQKRWVGAENQIEAMSKLGKLAGISDARLDACLASKELETAILKSRQDATAKFNVNATPSFVFNNGEKVASGAIDVTRMKDILSELN